MILTATEFILILTFTLFADFIKRKLLSQPFQTHIHLEGVESTKIYALPFVRHPHNMGDPEASYSRGS